MTTTIRYGNDMRILVVGGGIAGLTLAGLLEQRGLSPDVVEKSSNYGGLGYTLSLWPAGSNILKGLGKYDELLDNADQFEEYHVLDHDGTHLHGYDMGSLADEYGETYLIWRPNLVDVLQETISEENLRMGTTVTEIDQHSDEVDVTFTDGTTATYDLVVGADGIHSKVRDLVFGEVELTYHDMTGWAFWVDPSLATSGEVQEHWGAGRFVGLYPTEDKLACFLAATAPEGTPDPVDERLDRVRETFDDMGGLVPDILDEMDDPAGMWHDDFYDLHMDEWTKGRVVLIGDAGHAILPTGGVGASMAMESAAVLADELTRTDSKYLEQGLEHYVSRRRDRVDMVQKKSRRLGSFVMVQNHLLAELRDKSVKFYSQERMEEYFRDFLSSEI
ncbi:FAD-dependent monooxygenase [Haladaptatus sp. T7]|uniref:FAD-dependent monooxygenase n=1 Tax=Haladaptatus sp. T7 TaxID=2029368 RepID=UPI002231920E|nr:FAD-dependent monooxygenase [Haladaptatus sp. T7]